MSRRFSILVLMALALAIYVGTAASPALLDDADASHAVASQEMLKDGDWAVLHIDGIRYLEKPPLHYWLVAASYALLGESAFSTRLPLALAVVGLVLMVYVFGREYFGEAAGFYAGLVMCTSVGVFLFTRIMIPEAITALEFTAAFYLFLRAWTGRLDPRAGYWGAAALLGLAVLTRSLIGALFPLAILVLFLFLTGGWKRWRELRLFSSTAVFLGVTLPWHVVAGLRTPNFFRFYFLNEQVLRALGWRYPNDYEAVPLLLWLGAHLVWFLPWSFFLPLVLREIPRRQDWRRGLDASGQCRLLLFLWAAFILLFFSWTRSRMEYYSFGAWPAIALFLGVALSRRERENARHLAQLQAGLAALGLIAAGVLAAALWSSRNVPRGADITALLQTQSPSFYRVAMANLFDLTPRAFADLRPQAAGAALALLFGFSIAWLLSRRARHLASHLVLAATMAIFLLCANSAYAVFEPHLSSRPLAQQILKYFRPGDQIAIYGEYEAGGSVGFYTRQRLWIYNGRYNGLEFGANYADAPRIFLDDHSFPPLWHSAQRVFLVVPAQQRQNALVRLPPDGSYLLAEIGEKAVYVNQPVFPGQPNLTQGAAQVGRERPPTAPARATSSLATSPRHG